MADTFYFSRDTKVHLSDSGSAVYNIPVLDGFSFSQATNVTEVTLNEMATSAGVSRRARQMFTDSYAPAEWSFSTYIRPFKSAGTGSGKHSAAHHHMVEEPLWNALAGSGAIGASGSALTADGTDCNIAFTNSNKVALDTFDLHFEMGSGKASPTIYKIEGCVVNEVSIDFDIDGIATANWSGFGKIITEVTSMPTATLTEGTAATDTGNFIRNRLTDLTLTNDVVTDTVNGAVSSSTSVTLDNGSSLIKVGQVVSGTGVTAGTTVAAISGTTLTLSAAMSIADGVTLTFSNVGMTDTYTLTLTGGNVTIGNNITFLTPETLGSVNQPLGHVTGTRSVSGNFTCYLNTPSSGASSADLFEDIIESTSVITNSFDLTFTVGGTGNTPRMVMNLDNCHLEVPTHSIDDIISLETNFHALPTSVDAKDEIDLVFFGNTL
tara:strand:- start:847 stop:2154 length:1308 start_codon:yes stop_codon:yes gene_type:complete